MPTEAAPEARPAAALLALLLGALAGTSGVLLPPAAGVAMALLALALHGAGAAQALGHRPEGGLWRSLLRRLPQAMLAWLACAAIATVLLAGPLFWLLGEASLGPVLALSLAATLAWLALWRLWPWPQLCWTDRPRRRGRWFGPGESLRAARRLVDGDPSFARGLLAALLLTLLLAGSAACLQLAGRLDTLWAGIAVLVWWALLAPLLVFVKTALVEPARLAAPSDLAAQRPASPPPAKVDSGPPILLPGDPSVRLLAAARLGRIEEALSALDAGGDPHRLPPAGDRDQRTLVMLATVLSDTRLLRRLIALGADVNQRHSGLTPLLAATRDSLHGRPDAVMTLLANGADPAAADTEGRTALHFAALVAEPEVAALLLDAGAPIEALNRDGYSPLGVACGSGNWRIARFLLERKARPEPPGGQPALLAAAGGEDDPAGVQLLLRHKAKVDAPGRLGRTALLSAALAGNAAIAEALLGAGADPKRADEHGISPLLEAARAGAEAVLRLLARAAVDPAAVDRLGRNALLLACQSARSSADTIELLLALGVDAGQRAGDGRHALDVAVAQGRWPLVARLDPAYPLPTSVDTQGGSASDESLRAAAEDDLRPWPERLAEAVGEAAPSRIRAVLASAAVSPAELRDWIAGHVESLPRDVLAGLLARVDLAELERLRVLPEALASGQWPLARACLDRGLSPGGLSLAAWMARLASADAGSSGEALARDLLALGADPFACEAGSGALAWAVRRGWSALVGDLLRRGADPNARDANGATPLHRAAAAGAVEPLALLLRFGARVDVRNAEGCSPYGVALRHGRHDMLDWLDWQRWRLPGRRLRDSDLVAAAALGDVAAVERLLLLGLPIDARDAQGASALLRACGGGHLGCVNLLLQRHADPAATAASGATCLSAAISMRQRAVVERLLDFGASPEQTLPGGVTPVMVAAALGLSDMLALLLARGARPEQRDRGGQHALHALAQWGFTARDKARAVACWRALLQAAPAAADEAGEDGLSPMLLLLGARSDSGHPVDEDCLRAQLDVLLGQAIDLDRRDSRGFGPLHLCALHGQLAALRRLLQAGADREARDGLNRRPQDIAVMRGFVDIAAELEPLDRIKAPPPSLVRFLRES